MIGKLCRKIWTTKSKCFVDCWSSELSCPSVVKVYKTYPCIHVEIDDNQLVILNMKKSHEDALLGVEKTSAQVFLTPYDTSE